MQQLFFFHLPKAGGTSLRSALEKYLSGASFSPVFSNNVIEHRKLEGEYSSCRGYDVYCGHYGRDVYESVRENHKCITNFRHPLARIVSLYNYFRYMAPVDENQIKELAFRAVFVARQASFTEFVSSNDPLVEMYVCNAHYRQLSNSNWSLDQVSSVHEVCHFIDNMPCYYVCEFPVLSTLWMQRTLGISGIAVENVTQGDELLNIASLDHSILRSLYERNALDLALYRHAVDRLLRRDMGIHPS